MFSTAVVTQYAEVYMNTEPNRVIMAIALILAVLGLLVMIASIFAFDALTGITVGAVLLTLALIGDGFSIQLADMKTAEVERHMISNVREKYDAELKVDSKQIANLDKYRAYTLVFNNGATASYQIKFEQNGEPVIGEESAAPSIDELNKAGKN